MLAIPVLTRSSAGDLPGECPAASACQSCPRRDRDADYSPRRPLRGPNSVSRELLPETESWRAGSLCDQSFSCPWEPTSFLTSACVPFHYRLLSPRQAPISGTARSSMWHLPSCLGLGHSSPYSAEVLGSAMHWFLVSLSANFFGAGLLVLNIGGLSLMGSVLGIEHRGPKGVWRYYIC